MSQVIGQFIAPGTIEGVHLSQDAKDSVLQSRTTALRSPVYGVLIPIGVSSEDVTSQVEAVASNTTRQLDLSTGQGIYVGPISDTRDSKKVLIRSSGSDNGIDDGNSDEIFGKLSASGYSLILSFYKADGTAFTFGSATTIDFYFVELFDESTKPVDTPLRGGSTGTIDQATASRSKQALTTATSAQSAIVSHTDSGSSKHNASQINYQRISTLKKSIRSGSVDAESALSDLDDAVLTRAPVRIVLTSAVANLGNVPGILDGVTMIDGDRVLLTAQSTSSQNGVYRFNAGAPNTLTRASDFNQASQFQNGAQLFVREGSGANTIWFFIGLLSVLGSDPISFKSQNIASLFVQEVPSGLINGSNSSFSLSSTPAAQATLFLFLDSLLIPQVAGPRGYSLTGSTVLMGSPPALGQEFYAVYLKG